MAQLVKSVVQSRATGTRTVVCGRCGTTTIFSAREHADYCSHCWTSYLFAASIFTVVE